MKAYRSIVLSVLFITGPIACRGEAEPAPPSAQAVGPERRVTIPPTVSANRRTPVVTAVHNVLPAVVNIQTEATIRRRDVDPFFGFFGGDRAYQTQSVGSGFVWGSDGIIVTNAHVVEGASRIIANFHDGTELPARVIGSDPDSDLAVLRVDSRNLPAASLGSSADLLIGETVIAVGNPFGLGGSVTTGIVSATGRSVPSKEQGRTFTDFIQTDASINPGNSGGPLLNIEGRVIGINVAIYAQAQGIGFAIPVDRAKKIVEDLRRFGEVHGSWIGASTMTITPEESQRLGLAVRRGALVTRVFDGSPAERAGLRRGDVIVAAGGSTVDSREAFTTLTATARIGSRVDLRVQRGRGTVTIGLVPVEPPKNAGLRILEEISGLDVSDSRGSVVVNDVRRGSRGESIGLAPGDLIVGVNGVELRSVAELDRELLRSADRASVVLSIARGRYIYTITFPLGDAGETSV